MIMKAKFNSTCHETGKAIKKGESILYDRSLRKAFCSTSNRYEEANNEPLQDGILVQANEDAYFDNFCQNNGI